MTGRVREDNINVADCATRDAFTHEYATTGTDYIKIIVDNNRWHGSNTSNCATESISAPSN